MATQRALELDRVVLGFLRSRGYTKAQQALAGTMGVADIESFLEQQNMEDVDAKLKIVFHELTGHVAERFIESYTNLRAWIDSSLDKYKEELGAVLWPLYVHAYLDLLQQGETEGAQRFLEEFAQFHTDSHTDECNRLKGLLRVVEGGMMELERSEDFALFRSSKSEVPVSSYSCELLMTHLLEGRHLQLLALLNDYVSLRIVSRAPDTQPVIKYQGGAGDSQRPVLWGRLGSIISLATAAAPPEPLEPQAKRSRKRKSDDDAPAAAQEQVLVQSKIPLAELPASTQLRQQRDAALAAPVDARALPSISMLTFFHTNSSLNTVEISDDMSKVVGGLGDSSLRYWDIAAENTLRKGLGAASATNNYHHLIGHSGAVTSASFSPCQRYLLSSSEDNTVRLWGLETENKNALVAYKGHNYPVWDTAFSPLGYYFATASHDRTARIFTTDRVFPVRMLAGHLSDVDCVAWHPNSNYLATGSSDNSIRLWDVSSGECVRIFMGHLGPIYSLAFSPDGSQLASAGDDSTVGIWDIGSSKGVAVLMGHTKTVWSLDYDRTGNLLATGSQDGTVKLWDLKSTRSGQPSKELDYLVASYSTKKTPVIKVQFSSRNVLFAAGQADVNV